MNLEKYIVTNSKKADQGGKSPSWLQATNTFEPGEEVVKLSYVLHYTMCIKKSMWGRTCVCDEQVTQGRVDIKTVALDNSY